MSQESEETVGGRIQRRRLELGLTFQTLEQPGCTRTYIDMIEKGRRTPSAKAIKLLAVPLGVTAHWLETGDEDPSVELARLVLASDAWATPEMQDLAQSILQR